MNFINIMISLVLSIIMFGIGSSLDFSHFKEVIEKPKALLGGLVMQMIFLPLFAIIIILLSSLSPEYKLGIFIVTICPGGATSNFISYLVNAKTALSIALTSINSILILFTIPLFIKASVFFIFQDNVDTNISISNSIIQVFAIVIIPAILGLLFNIKFADIASKLQKPLKVINSVLLFIVFSIKFFASKDLGGTGIDVQDFFHIIPYCLIVHLGAMIISFLTSNKLLLLTKLESTTISIEVGLQNTVLALLIVGSLFNNDEMAKPALVFATFSFFTTLLFAYITTRWKSEKRKSEMVVI